MAAVLRCKVVVVGEAKAGKSALVQTFSGKEFPKNYVMTLGADLCVREVAIPDSERVVELHVFDVAGGAAYATLRNTYLEGFNAAVLVYNVADAASFRACRDWGRLLAKAAGGRPLHGVLVGTRGDLAEYAEVKLPEAERLAGELGLSHFVCSALAGGDVDAPFNFVAADFDARYAAALAEFSDE